MHSMLTPVFAHDQFVFYLRYWPLNYIFGLKTSNFSGSSVWVKRRCLLMSKVHGLESSYGGRIQKDTTVLLLPSKRIILWYLHLHTRQNSLSSLAWFISSFSELRSLWYLPFHLSCHKRSSVYHHLEKESLMLLQLPFAVKKYIPTLAGVQVGQG